MFFGALVFWAAISFTGKTTTSDEEAIPADVALSDAAGEPEGGEPGPPVRYESTFFAPALRVEAETKVLRPANLSVPRVARARWATATRAECGAVGQQAWLVAGDHCRATEMRVLARPVQAHSPPARC